MKYASRIIINAPSFYVFQKIKERDFYQQCEPECVKISGDFSDKKTVKLYFNNHKISKIKKCFLSIIEGEQIVLKERSLIPLRVGIRSIRILAKDDHTCEVLIEEIYSGILYEKGWLKPPATQKNLDQFVYNLKKLIEARPK